MKVIVFLFFFFFGLQDLSSLTRVWSCTHGSKSTKPQPLDCWYKCEIDTDFKDFSTRKRIKNVSIVKNIITCWNEHTLGCHCFLVPKSCLTLCDPMDCSPPGSSVHGILQARILEWVAISLFPGSSWPRGQTLISLTGRQILYHWVTGDHWVKSNIWLTWISPSSFILLMQLLGNLKFPPGCVCVAQVLFLLAWAVVDQTPEPNPGARQLGLQIYLLVSWTEDPLASQLSTPACQGAWNPRTRALLLGGL